MSAKERSVKITVSGGPYDGVSVDSNSAQPNEHVLATVFFRWAKADLIGKSFTTMSPGAIASAEDETAKDGLLQNHKYVLASLVEIDEEIFAQFIYQGHASRDFVDD